ncbi:MAG: DmsC/YnfH family molybdoenzyme membrane anchor subunit [Thiotrichaceae bacterium]
MHPAFSVIFLTTLLGIAQGLFTALITAQVYTLVELVPVDESNKFYAMGTLIVIIFVGLALFASFFHLGRPERAWRTVSQWRTSWLSREVIALPSFGAVAFIYGVIQWFGLDFEVLTLGQYSISFSLLVGLLGVALSFALFICTGMIYTCIRFLQEWSTPLTVINFTMLGLASGFTVATLYATYTAPGLVNMFGGWAIFFTVFAAITRISSLIRNSRIKPKSTPTSAIGVRHSKITQMTQGAMGGSYNTREYFHGKTDTFLRVVKWSFLVLAFVVPLVLLITGLITKLAVVVFAAAVIQYVGLILERWFFFAQANHPQNIYYQAT